MSTVFAAVKKKLTAIPMRMILRCEIPAIERISSSNKIDVTAKTNAETLVPNRIPDSCIPSAIATLAPNAAADEIPSVKGEASEFPRIICISAPANPKQEPAVSAIRTCGKRIFNTTCNSLFLCAVKLKTVGKNITDAAAVKSRIIDRMAIL